MNGVRHILVLHDRDAAEGVAESLADLPHSRLRSSGGTPNPLSEEPQLVREELAGEDAAEDAQWLVVVADPVAAYDPAALGALAAEYEGWLERE